MQGLLVDFRPIPQQIAELLQVSPHSTALSHGTRELTYEQLDHAADRFAGYLVERGLQSGDAVALCMERSFAWIIAALGIMRAGAAYVPLDAAWPDARLSFALQDSGAKILVARASLLQRLQTEHPDLLQGVDPERDAAAIEGTPRLAQRALAPDSLAYMIYTSGSTGTPKAVEITHANLNHLVRWHRDTFHVTAQDRASHLLGLGFDAAVMEIWPHLAAGATLCLADESVRTSPQLIQEWMMQQRVTIALMPTVLGERLMALEWLPATTLRLLVIGGDVLHQGPLHPLPFEVVNNYGPTECTVAATYAVLAPGATGAPPIGRPITGTTIYLLDEHGALVLPGEAGEIYIGGDSVGRGYRNRPELTAEKFLLDPFALTPGARMYRTGDRGALRQDGQIDFRGRQDRQTKIRGFRVELDEIAATLSRHGGIDFATVNARPSDTGEKQLVAYVLPRAEAVALTANDLQQHLLKTLPDYMVPSTFIRLAAMPLSANGKIDPEKLSQSTVLLQRSAVLSEAHSEHEGAGSSIEQKVLVIVRDLLKNDQVGTADNFFLVGGHSLLGTQLLVRLRSEFGVDLALRQLFESPTVEGLSRLVESIVAPPWLAGVWADVLRRDAVQPEDDFFVLGGGPELLAAVQRRIALEFGRQIPIEELMSHPTLSDQADLIVHGGETQAVLPLGVIALQPKGTQNSIFWIHYFNFSLSKVAGEERPFLVVRLMAEDFPTLGTAPDFAAIAARHVEKIVATQVCGPYTVGGLCLGAVLAFEVAQQLRAAGHAVSLLMLDPPSPSLLDASVDVRPRWTQPLYLLKRVSHLGLKTSVGKLRQRMVRKVTLPAKADLPKTEVSIAQEMIEKAASTYQPQRYDGPVLMLLASEKPPHLDFLSAWQAMIPNGLDAQYLPGHHEDLIYGASAPRVMDAVHAHLAPGRGGQQPESDRLGLQGDAQQECGVIQNAEFQAGPVT